MRVGYLDLPTIWRGCDYPAVSLVWTDENGQPLDLTGWTPKAWTSKFDLNAEVIVPTVGRTRVSMTKDQTSDLKLGIESWDWVWVKDDFPFTVTRPMIRGKVPIKEAVTNPLSPP